MQLVDYYIVEVPKTKNRECEERKKKEKDEGIEFWKWNLDRWIASAVKDLSSLDGLDGSHWYVVLDPLRASERQQVLVDSILQAEESFSTYF